MSERADENRSFLHLEDVTKSYGSHLVLADIDLRVRKGELCTVVGPSGCGKSTLLRLVLGQERPTSGTILLDGRRIGHPDKSRGIVYQRYSLYPHLTVLDNVILGNCLEYGVIGSRLKKREFKDQAAEYLRRVGLSDHQGKYPHQLSGGMQQRVAIVQSLMMRPKILLMDEPFGALDPGTREDMQIFLLELWEQLEMTVFFVTHDLEEALYLGTRVLVLSQHYSCGKNGERGQGSRIVADYELQHRVLPTSVKTNPEFLSFVAHIRKEGFDERHLQHVEDFNLKHPDSFQTLDSSLKR